MLLSNLTEIGCATEY